MPYPSVITSFTNPQPTDRLNSPSHSSIETAQNTGLTELQTFVGTLASTAGTLIYDIRAAASNGGGHVQAENKGGTGQTSYTKGNILVATSSSVLAKLAVGNNGEFLTADDTQNGGVRWAAASPFIGLVTTQSSFIGGTSFIGVVETTVYSSVLSAGFFGTNTGLRVRGNFQIKQTVADGNAATANVKYNGSVVAQIDLGHAAIGGNGTSIDYKGSWNSVILNNNNIAAQRSLSDTSAILAGDISVRASVAGQTISEVRTSVVNAAVDTASAVTLAITYRASVPSSVGWISDGLTVEKIIKIAP